MTEKEPKQGEPGSAVKLKLQKPQWIEKRDSVRLELECPAKFQILKKRLGIIRTKSSAYRGLTIKLSLNGLRLLTKMEMPEGTELLLEVEMQKLGYDRAFKLYGTVRWSKFSGVTKEYEQGVQLREGYGDIKTWRRMVLEQIGDAD